MLEKYMADKAANRTPGTYSLIECSFINFKGNKIDVKSVMNQLDIQIDMFNTCIFGSIEIHDRGGNFQQNMPLIGEERLSFKFKVDEATPQITLLFDVYHLARNIQSGENSMQYILYFASHEFLANQTILVSDGFVRKHPHDIIQSCMKRISNKKIDVEESANLINYVSPSIHPFEVINYIIPRSISKTSNSTYVFYEDINGFNFKTIEKMYESTPIDYYFTKKNLTNTNFETEYYSITSYEIVQSYNTLDNMSKGAYGATVFGLDPFTRDYTQVTYNYHSDEDFKKLKHIDNDNPKNKLHTSQYQYKNAFQGFLKCLPISESHQSDKFKNIAKRNSQINLLSNGLKIVLQVAGNSDILIGSVINIAYPNKSKDNDKNGLDKYLQGKYIVTAVRHIFTQTKYTTVMEIARDVYHDNHENYDRTTLLT